MSVGEPITDELPSFLSRSVDVDTHEMIPFHMWGARSVRTSRSSLRVVLTAGSSMMPGRTPRFDPTFSASRPRVLFVGRFEMGFLVPGARFYDVSADSQRFLMLRSEDLAAPRQLRLVVNWFEELRRLVPRPGD